MKRLQAWAGIFGVLSFAACGSNSASNADADTTRIRVAVASAAELAVELLTKSQLETGMTPVYISIVNATGAQVKDATVSFTPMMAMSNGVSHTCPVMGAPVVGPDGVYATNVVFLMPTSDSGSWSATVDIVRADGSAVQASFPTLIVADSGRMKSFTYTDPVTAAQTKFISSLNFVAPPKVGLNPVVFTLHRKQDMMTFPSVDDAAIVLDPEMPSMGHGSPGSIDPVLTAPGRYEGKVSFSMAGEWQVGASVTQSGLALGAPTFTVTF